MIVSIKQIETDVTNYCTGNQMIKLSIIIVSWLLAFGQLFPGFFDAWFKASNTDNSYGILVPFISGYFIWLKRGQLMKLKIESESLGLAILIISLAVYIVSYAGGVLFFQRTMMVLSLIGVVIYLFGKEVFKAISFPLLFLFFMVPLPVSVVGLVSFPMQTYATIISGKIIQFCGIPVYREGHMLYFTQTQLEVAEACSGIHSITALLMLSMIFMYLCKNGKAIKTIIVLSSVVIAFIANILRVSGTGILAHFFGAGVARGFLHEFSGMAVFAFGLVLLFIEYKLLNRKWSERR
jgi:exosortase